MKGRLFLIILVLVFCLSVHAQSFFYFDQYFGYNSFRTRETLEGIETEIVFTLNGTSNLINIIMIERANGDEVYLLSCSERNERYSPVKIRMSIDGDIKNFVEDSPQFTSSSNSARWFLSDKTINQMLNCNEIAIEFGDRVYRYNENDYVINYYGSISTFKDPLGQIKQFLQLNSKEIRILLSGLYNIPL